MLKEIPYFFDEPFADSSQIPTLLLCKESKKFITVALTGDGGDEVFGGYNRHILGPKILKVRNYLPKIFVNSNSVNILAKPFIGILTKLRILHPNSKLRLDHFVDVFKRSSSFASFYEYITDISNDSVNKVLAIKDSYSDLKINDSFSHLDLCDQEALMMLDFLDYLPSDVLVKVDRASMRYSLETRAPFLDRRVVEHSWSLNIKTKINRNSGKFILKKILQDFIPDELISRPKQGFSIPLDDWLRNPLSSWKSKILNEERIRFIGVLNYETVKNLIDRHDEGENHGALIWNILILQLWCEQKSIQVR